jgi:hypothetical protein
MSSQAGVPLFLDVQYLDKTREMSRKPSATVARVDEPIGFYSVRPITAQLNSSMALDRLPPPAFTAYGLQSIIQHVAHFPLGSGAGC